MLSDRDYYREEKVQGLWMPGGSIFQVEGIASAEALREEAQCL